MEVGRSGGGECQTAPKHDTLRHDDDDDDDDDDGDDYDDDDYDDDDDEEIMQSTRFKRQ